MLKTYVYSISRVDHQPMMQDMCKLFEKKCIKINDTRKDAKNSKTLTCSMIVCVTFSIYTASSSQTCILTFLWYASFIEWAFWVWSTFWLDWYILFHTTTHWITLKTRFTSTFSLMVASQAFCWRSTWIIFLRTCVFAFSTSTNVGISAVGINLAFLFWRCFEIETKY